MLVGMPRRSAASYVVPALTRPKPAPIPPDFLPTSERQLFIDAAKANTHLVASDAPTLAAWSQAMVKVHTLGRGDDTVEFERAVRVMLALARALRLVPSATQKPESVYRKRMAPSKGTTPWGLHLDEDSDGCDA
jgi:hypothetical protein